MAARLLTIMGSGETSPTMVKTHRDLFARLGPPPVHAVLLDTPFGFQMNADDIAARAVQYFRESVGQEITVASYRSAADSDAVDTETAAARVREARYIFAGPGSPSYALRQWAASPIPALLEEKLVRGGCITFASAAALTLGVKTVPVYEVYKVGEDPRWLDGLNLLSSVGIEAAVIPHYNNAEGGNHDTRFCYLGEERLSHLEDSLGEDSFVLGVDEHTGLVIDLDSGNGTVVGRGVVTVRVRGKSTELSSGVSVGVKELRAIADDLRAGEGRIEAAERLRPAAVAEPVAETGTAASPLLEAVERCERQFEAGLAAGDARGAVAAILALDDELVAWQADTLQSDEMDRARAALRSMVVRLGELASTGTRDPAELVGPYVDALLAERRRARETSRWSDADSVRDTLVDLGVEVRDTPDGTTWSLR